jgi:hypothetical protein
MKTIITSMAFNDADRMNPSRVHSGNKASIQVHPEARNARVVLRNTSPVNYGDVAVEFFRADRSLIEKVIVSGEDT